MYKYDAKGNLYTVTDVTTGSDKLMAKYSYDANDNLSSVTYGNGTSTTYTYNNGNMIQTVSNIGADNKNMSYYSYEYYLDGNVSKQNRNGVNCYYDYDEFSRITDEDYGNEEIDYYYDAAGNRTMKTICDDNGDTEVDYAYDLNNRLLEESNHSYANNKTDVTKYVYDNNGNQIKKIGYTTKDVNGSPSQDLVSENELNKMTSLESNKEAVWYYAYLPNGLRYRKHKNNYNNSDWFVWDRNGNIIAEMNNNKEYTNKYVRGNKLISKDGNEYFGYDGHGSVVNISDESGKSIKSYDYDAFGVELNKDANDTNLFRYCGEQYDNETDSIYLRARYYSPSLGRFTTEDPAKDGDNWYSYCAGNPVVRADRSGMKPYDLFNSPDEAAIDFAKYTNEDSIKYSVEYGAGIYKVTKNISIKIGDKQISLKKDYYSYTKPYTNNATNYVKHDVENMKKILKENGNELIGIIHTHASLYAGYNFKNFYVDEKLIEQLGKEKSTVSELDKLFAEKNPELLNYLVTPTGLVKEYGYKDKLFGGKKYHEKIIYKKAPTDKNYKLRGGCF